MTKDTFKIVDYDFLPERCLLLNGEWQSKFADVMEKEKINCLRLSYSAGWKSTDLSFLSEVPFLKGLDVYSYDVFDLSDIEKLKQLEHFSFDDMKLKIGLDFTKLPNLKSCSGSWSKKVQSLFECDNLERLSLDKYPGSDLELLSTMEKLEFLHLQSRKMTSLNGIENLNLSNLELAYCTGLSDIYSIKKLPEMTHVEFTSCKKVFDFSSLSYLKKLKKLLIEGCGSIQSLSFLTDCSDLEELYLIDVKIEDGDCSPIIKLGKLKKLALASKRNHSHTGAELKKKLGIV
jgi:hypothetical protein